MSGKLKENSCSTCRYFLPDAGNGECHRYPPTVVLEKVEVDYDERCYPIYEIQPQSYFPEVNPIDVCGEYKNEYLED